MCLRLQLGLRALFCVWGDIPFVGCKRRSSQRQQVRAQAKLKVAVAECTEIQHCVRICMLYATLQPVIQPGALESLESG